MLGSCYPSTEVLLMALLRGLLRERVLPPGAIIDAGANTGYEACQLAAAAPERTVHAVDPDSANVRSIATLGKMHNLTNLRPLQGGLGEKSALIHMRTSASSGLSLKRADAGGGLLQSHSIDDLFAGSRGRKHLWCVRPHARLITAVCCRGAVWGQVVLRPPGRRPHGEGR